MDKPDSGGGVDRGDDHESRGPRFTRVESFTSRVLGKGARKVSLLSNSRLRSTGASVSMANGNLDTAPAAAGSSSSSTIPSRQSSPAATYHRILINGDEGDRDFVKCAEVIADIVRARQAYKNADKGQKEDLLTQAELESIAYGVPLAATSTSPLPSSSHPLTGPETTAVKVYTLGESCTTLDLFATSHTSLGGGGGSISGGGGGGAGDGARGHEPFPTDPILSCEDGVYRFEGMKTPVVPWSQYVKDIQAVFGAIENGPCLSTARRRLNSLRHKFHLYQLLNNELERNYHGYIKGGGVYARCARVDTGLHLKACVSAPTFLDFIVTTATEKPHTPLYEDERTDEPVGIREYLGTGGVHEPEQLTIEGLGLHPTLYRNKFLPYNMFNEQLNPAGAFGTKLLQCVLSTNSPNEGQLCGALIRSELERYDFKTHPVVATEIALDVYGHNPRELPLLASWVHRQGFNGFTRNRWILTIPREAPCTGPNELCATCKTIADQLRNLFYPLLMATLHPCDPQWVELANLLAHTSAVSIRTCPAIRTSNLETTVQLPSTIRYSQGCTDYYFFYYVWANLTTLNALRARFGLNTLQFRPSVHEQAPAYDQLVASFLLGDVVHNVSSLCKSWIMQYLYLYCRIGIVMCPLRDNALSTAYFDHPIVDYFHQGMLVSLATVEPLHFHHRAEQPLIEEYATLMKLRSLTPMDLCELARNSVLNSNFPRDLQQAWLGDEFSRLGSDGNDVTRSCVCDYRLQFRHECLVHEELLLNLMLSQAAKKGQVPNTVSLIPCVHSIHVPDYVQQFRHARHMDYTNHRIVYPRIDVYGGESEKLATEAVEMLRQMVLLRKKYTNFRVVDVAVEDVFSDSHRFDEDVWEFNHYYGVYLLSRVGKTPSWPKMIPPVQEFIQDVETIRKVVSSRALHGLAQHRLNLLQRRFLLHLSMNISNEAGAREEKEWNNRDFFTAHKVNTNVQTDASPNARTLLEYFVDKALNHGDDVVFEENDSPVTLRQLLRRYNINVQQITVDELHYQMSTHRDLRNIFLSPMNFMQGRYFAELVKRTLNMYQEDEYNFAENRLRLSGSSQQEWYDLAHWFDRYGMASSQSRWMVSFPRQYRPLRKQGKVSNFGQYLDNLFRPLWEISLHPTKDIKFHYFLTHVSGFDCNDDESKIDLPLDGNYPHDWNSDLNPPYNLYLYYFWANIASLNEFRASRGLGTFSFRPQCGELGGMDHLIGGFLLANGISHGVTLAKYPALEYVYYITQLGVAMSPLSNTAEASAYLENPFPVFFHRGLNVSLATNKPLYFHFTREPLIEEYSIAAKLWKFEFNDLSEIARNSVLQSGFQPAWKEKTLGKFYQLRSTLGNDVRKSRVSDIRVAYRYEVYHTELNFLDAQLNSVQRMPRAMQLLEAEVAMYKATAARGDAPVWDCSSPPEDDDADGQLHSVTEEDGFDALPCELERHGGTPSAAVDSSGDGVDSYGEELDTARLRTEIARLDRELIRMRMLTLQVAGQNSSIAAAVNQLRSRLKTEGLSVLAALEPRSGAVGGGTGGGEEEQVDHSVEVSGPPTASTTVPVDQVLLGPVMDGVPVPAAPSAT